MKAKIKYYGIEDKSLSHIFLQYNKRDTYLASVFCVYSRIVLIYSDIVLDLIFS